MSLGAFIKPQNLQEVERGMRDIQKLRDSDVAADVICISPKRLILQSPDGRFWSVTVADTGALVTNDLGLTPP